MNKQQAQEYFDKIEMHISEAKRMLEYLLDASHEENLYQKEEIEKQNELQNKIKRVIKPLWDVQPDVYTLRNFINRQYKKK